MEDIEKVKQMQFIVHWPCLESEFNKEGFTKDSMSDVIKKGYVTIYPYYSGHDYSEPFDMIPVQGMKILNNPSANKSH